MNNEFVDIGRNKFLKMEVLPVSQKGKVFYITKIPARFLLETFTVNPTEYKVDVEAANAATFQDYAEYFEYRLREDRGTILSKKYQRILKQERVEEIAEFLNTDEYALFPNTIIVTCELINTSLEYEPGNEDEIYNLLGEAENPLSFLQEPANHGDKYFLYVPYKEKSILLIDGQHRLEGIKKAKEEVISNYDLMVSFIIGVSWSVVARLFYTINYTQKAVNKSLLYHLTGEFSPDLDEITFMHEIVRALNEVEISPFFKRVKMLGVVDYSLPAEERAKMTISQAFLVEYLLNTVSKKAKDSIYPPILLYYYQRREKWRVEIVKFIMKYFSAIQELKTHDWNSPASSIICNTLGVGAFIRILYFMFVKMFTSEFDKNPSMLKDVGVGDIVDRLRGIENVDFSRAGEYGGVASGGSLNKLREELVISINYFNASSYNSFMEEYRSNYLRDYKDWLIKNTKLEKD